MPANFLLQDSFSLGAIFVRSLHIFYTITQNVQKHFTVTEYGKTHTRFFSALGPESEEQIKLAEDRSRFDLFFWTLAFRVREKLDSSF